MWNVIGHEWAVALLRRALAEGRVAHAYLLSGPPQVGKTTLARAFAAALLCTSQDPPCGACRHCRLVARDGHPDVRLIRRAPDRTRILLDDVQELRHGASLSPLEGARKVFVVRLAEQLGDEAANSLLKTLEEPPGDVVIILTAVSARSVLPTVVSRCQQLNLRPVRAATIAAALQERGVPAERAAWLARRADGRVGWALRAAADTTVEAQRTDALAELAVLRAGDRLGRLQRARALGERWASQPDEVRELLRHWLGWWRDALLVQYGAERHVVNQEEIQRLRAIGREAARRGMRAVLEALTRLDQNVNARLAFDVLALDLPA